MSRTTERTNHNRYRSYPLLENTNAMVGGSQLPTDVLVDLLLLDYTNGLGTYAPIYLKQLTVTADEVLFEFSRTLNGAVHYTATAPLAASWPYAARSVVDTSAAHYDLLCVVHEGCVALAAALGVGTHAVTNGQIEPACVQYQTRHRVLSFVGDTLTSVPVAGTVHVKEGAGIGVIVTPALNQVRLSAAPGAGTGYNCEDGVQATGTITGAMDQQPTGYVSIMGMQFYFGDPPAGSGSGSGSGDFGSGSTSPYVPYDGDVYIAYGAEPADTLYHLAVAIGLAFPDVEVAFAADAGVLTMLGTNTFVTNIIPFSPQLSVSVELTPPLCGETAMYLNDVTADGYGGVQLVGGRGIVITAAPAEHQLVIENKLTAKGLACKDCETP